MTNPGELVDILVNLAKIASKAEHSSGKIVLEIPNTQIPKLISNMGNMSLEEEVGKIPGLTGYKVRPGLLKTKLDIKYDPEKIPYDLWESLMEISKAPDTIASVTDRLKGLFTS